MAKGNLCKKSKLEIDEREKQITYLIFRDMLNFLGLNPTSMHAKLDSLCSIFSIK
jgi:hypothetical protein